MEQGGMIPRTITRPSTRRPTIPHAHRARLVASASASDSVSTATASLAPAPTPPPQPSSVAPDRQALIENQLVDLLFGILSPFSLASRSHDQDWTQRLWASTPDAPLHVNRLLQIGQVNAICESGVEISLALRQLDGMGWFRMSDDGYSFYLRTRVREDLQPTSQPFWEKLVEQDRIVYTQDLPAHLSTPRKVCAFVHGLLGDQSSNDEARVYDAYPPSGDMKPAWLSRADKRPQQRTRHGSNDCHGARIRFAQAFVVLSSSEAASQLATSYPWQAKDVGDAHKRRLRILTIKQWIALRSEYFAWRAQILEHGRSSPHRARPVDVAPTLRRSEDVADARAIPAIPDEDPTKTYPVGTIIFLSNINLSNSTLADATATSRAIKAKLERLVPSSVGYVDLHPPSNGPGPGSREDENKAGCHVRTPDRFTAHHLVSLLYSTAQSASSFLDSNSEVRILDGEEEEAYWDGIPPKTRNAAKKKALAAIPLSRAAAAAIPRQVATATGGGGSQSAATKPEGRKRKAAQASAAAPNEPQQPPGKKVDRNHIKFD
ncbi:uncharacterized protein PFL1_02058 [Pseudozyma flocculosa PF-1]|uniref:uncharacterized protein n=1 Tax=Pseudozyma flocculosa PF-1 TaxID=1277687 RepID=UPI000456144C|nr:uncharacterized protein PFL1_02058 [Pseudozyma flocculosa PF-1]EPQ30532.1 hypothetical protein PFL1_02058 [Pseudozyma flocculosa PF-1]